MKIERISENKIKVEVNREDTREWDINIKCLSENSPQLQKLFRYAIKKAEEKFNFSIGESKVVVEAIPLTSETFVLIINLPDKTRNKKHKEVFSIYKFDDFDDLCSGISEIFDLFYGKSSAYKFKEKYYLILKPFDLFGFYETDNKLSEFSEKLSNPYAFSGKLNEEACVLVKENAIDVLTSYFN